MTTQNYTLSCGMELLLDYMPHLHSVASGLWVKCGSVYEEAALAGGSHFLEHMLFKGTAKRSALQISAEMEEVGGILNAFTGKELTCFYARSLNDAFGRQIDLLADMYRNSLLDGEEFAKEKKVIMEEINMYEDSPDEVAMDLFTEAMYPGHTYGAAISGSLKTVEALTRDQLWRHYRRFYGPANTVLAIAGNVTMEQAIEIAEEKFAGFSGGEPAPAISRAIPSSAQRYIHKDIEQSHICIGFPACAMGDKDYFAMAVLGNLFGGGASSRLFQEVREKRGLSYSAYCYQEAYREGGYLMSYAATTPARRDELTQVICEQYALLLEKGVTEKEIRQSIDQIKGGLLLSLESSATVMSKLGRMRLMLDQIYDPQHTVDMLEAVTAEDIQSCIERYICPQKAVLAHVGPEPLQVELGGLLG